MMWAAVATAYGVPLDIRRVREPEPDSRGAVVRVGACGICRSDWHLWKGDWTWRTSVAFPRILGHELAGQVVALGSDVRRIKLGIAVTVPFHLSCDACRACLSGHAGLCETYTALGFQLDGGFAEYVFIPNADRNLIPLPAAMPYTAAAALGCRFMSAYHALADRTTITVGSCVVVFGAGGVGLAVVQIARMMGARVVAVDLSEGALAMALREGAIGLRADLPGLRDRLLEIAGPDGVATTVDAYGSARTTLPALEVLTRGGTHLQIGLTGAQEGGMMTLPVDQLVKREQRIVGSIGCPQTSYRPLLEHVSANRLSPERLVTRVLTLDDLPEALAGMGVFAEAGSLVVAP
jgi:D-arabinose 1-dehydrogenase-like Zn-dependent alcohol dehydrogenase